MKRRSLRILFLTAIPFWGALAILTFAPGRGTHDTDVAAVIFPEKTEGLVVLEPALFPYIEITESCGPYFEGECVNMRSGPGKEFPTVSQLRRGVVLKVAGVVTHEGNEWYKMELEKNIRYPERVSGEWYVSADVADLLYDSGMHDLADNEARAGTKTILIDRSEQKLYAYEGDALFMEEKISTGIELTPTPRGTFTIYRMTPSRYMQGPLPDISEQYYDLPGVPWNLYFTKEGGVIHGAYWHDKFGQPRSNGCVNLPPDKARELYLWAELGTTVIVRD